MKMELATIPAGMQTAAFLPGRGVLRSVPELLRTFFPGRKPWIIADENTWQVAGKTLADSLKKEGTAAIDPYIFPGTPRLHPLYDTSLMLADRMPANCVPVAVGSGVINDIVKCASGMKKIHYCCVATACSVDGYTASGSSMLVDGSKKTVPCPAPYAICADSEIMETAPPEMFAAGYADLLAKVTGGADWLIADAMEMEPVRQDVWDLVQTNLRQQIADPGNMTPVFHGLAASGYAMQLYLDSRPASGCEHLFSHVWEMENLQFNGEDVSHGFKVGVGTLAATLLFQYIIDHDFDELIPRMKAPLTPEERQQEVAFLARRGCYGTLPEDNTRKKYLTPGETLRKREKIRAVWPELQKRLQKQIIPFPELRQMLQKAGCPTTPAEIGLDREQFLNVIPMAQTIRVRYTVLDLLYECGLLDDAGKSHEVML